MDLKKGSTIGGKRIATIDDLLKLEAIVDSGGGSGSGGSGEGGGSGETTEPTYKLEVLSTAGTVARNGTIRTTLYGRVYRSGRDVTDVIVSSGKYAFYWERYTGDLDYDKAQDLLWANNRFEGIEQRITGDDIAKNKSTAFFCSMYDKETNVLILSSKND